MKGRIKTSQKLLKMIGLWPDNIEYKPGSFYQIFAILQATCTCIFFILPQAINIFLIINDLDALSSSIQILMSDFNGIIKAWLFMKYLPLVKIIMDALDNDLYQPKNNPQIAVMMDLFKPWSVIYKTLLTFGHFAVGSWLILPIWDHKLPFLAWYPVDQQQTPFYELIYFYQIFSVYYLALSNIVIDGLFAAIILYIAAQCEFLCDNLRNIHQITKQRLIDLQLNNKINEDMIIDQYTNTLKVFVKHHRGVLDLAENSNTLFSFIVAFQFLTSILAICMTMFQLSLAEPLSNEFFSLLIYQICLFLEILLYCWCGNEAIVSSQKIPWAAYESAWIDSNLEFKKNLIFFIRRTQKPICLYALEFFTLSLTTFISILRMSWSYFALLRQVNSRNE